MSLDGFPAQENGRAKGTTAAAAAGPIPAATAVSIDTIEVFARWLPNGFRRNVQAILGRRIRIRTLKHGYMIVINRPPLEVLPVLHAVTQDRRFKACVSRVDVAYDFKMQGGESALAAQEWLFTHVTVKWLSGKGKFKHRGDDGSWTGYWARGHKGRRPDIYLKGGSAVRLELKFIRAATVRRAELDDLSKLPAINPKNVLTRNIKLRHIRDDKYRIRCMRRAVREDINKARNNRITSKFADKFRATIARRVASLIQRVGCGGDIKEIGTGFLRIPEEISWPALKLKENSEKAEG